MDWPGRLYWLISEPERTPASLILTISIPNMLSGALITRWLAATWKVSATPLTARTGEELVQKCLFRARYSLAHPITTNLKSYSLQGRKPGL